MAELALPGHAERAVTPHEVVQVRNDRLREVTAERGRRNLLEMDDVRLGGTVANTFGKLAPPELLEWPSQTEGPRSNPGRLGLDVDDLDPVRRISGGRPGLPRGEHAQVDAVLAQAADQRQRAPAGGASFGKRRLGQDEQSLHAASASR